MARVMASPVWHDASGPPTIEHYSRNAAASPTTMMTNPITSNLKSLFGDGNVSGVKLSDAIRKTEYERNLLLNDYVLSKNGLIGSGVTSKVKLAVSLQLGQKFAVKILNKTKLLQNRIMRRRSSEDSDCAYREIAVLRKLQHPNIVKLMEVLDDPVDDYLYMVFELVPNGPILNVPTDFPLSVDKAWKYFRDIIAGVEYLHSNHIVHRDLKPDNMLVDEHDNVKISDFGTSIEWHYNDQVANPHCTPAFTAPECLSEEAYLQSGSAMDIWSVGITLYAVLTGRVPWSAVCYMGLIEEIKSSCVMLPVSVAGVDSNLRDLMRQLLDTNPRTRIDSYELKFHAWVTRDGRVPCAVRKRHESIQVSAHEVKTSVRKITRTESLMLLEQASHLSFDSDEDDADTGDEEYSDADEDAVCYDAEIRSIDADSSGSQNDDDAFAVTTPAAAAAGGKDQVDGQMMPPPSSSTSNSTRVATHLLQRSGRTSRNSSGRSNGSVSGASSGYGSNGQQPRKSNNSNGGIGGKFPYHQVNRFFSVPHKSLCATNSGELLRAQRVQQPSVIMEEKMSQANTPDITPLSFDCEKWKFSNNKKHLVAAAASLLLPNGDAVSEIMPTPESSNASSGSSIATTAAATAAATKSPPSTPLPVASVCWSTQSPPSDAEEEEKLREQQQQRMKKRTPRRRGVRCTHANQSKVDDADFNAITPTTTGADDRRPGVRLCMEDDDDDGDNAISPATNSSAANKMVVLSMTSYEDNDDADMNAEVDARSNAAAVLGTHRPLPLPPRQRNGSGRVSVVPTPDDALLIPQLRVPSPIATTSTFESRGIVAPEVSHWTAGTRERGVSSPVPPPTGGRFIVNGSTTGGRTALRMFYTSPTPTP